MEKVKNKRNMREVQHRDPFANEKGTGPIRHKAGTKPARKAKKYEAEMGRKHSKEALKEAAIHMHKHAR
jgi:hypothetical protein